MKRLWLAMCTATLLLAHVLQAAPIIMIAADPENRGGAGAALIGGAMNFGTPGSSLAGKARSSSTAPIIMLQMGGDSGPIGRSGLNAAQVAGGLGFGYHVVNSDSIATVDLSQYDAIYMPSTSDIVQGGVTPYQLDLILQRKADIAQFMANGGGVIAFAQTLPGGFGWLPIDCEVVARGGTSGAHFTHAGLDIFGGIGMSIPFFQAFPDVCDPLVPLILEAGEGTRPVAIGGDLTPTIDTTPPVITPRADDPVLGVANHAYRSINARDCLLAVSYAGDPSVGIDDVQILSVSSDEPEDAVGDADGRTLRDMVIASPRTVRLRAERQKGGNGRVYTITFGVSDASGNRATATMRASVPGDPLAPAVEGPGPGYTVVASSASGELSHKSGVQPDGGIQLVRQGGLGVSFSLSNPATARLDVYDVRGRLVRGLEAAFPAGNQIMRWDGVTAEGHQAATGIYLLRLRAGESAWSTKGVWIRD